MLAAPRMVATRVWRKGRWQLLILSLLLLFSQWLPVAAQTPAIANNANPATVVLPPLQMRLPLVIGDSTTALNCPLTSSNNYETLQTNGPHKHDFAPSL